MHAQPIPFEKCLFICENKREDGRACCSPASSGLRERLKAYVKTHGLTTRVRIAKAGCLDRCAHGPNVFVYPHGVWYSGVTTDTEIECLIATELLPMCEPKR